MTDLRSIAVPHLSGIFVALDDTTAARSSWRDDLQAMKDVGIEFFIISISAPPQSRSRCSPLM
jgi:hypothetical protein